MKKTKNEIPSNENVEVVMRKEMPYSEYLKLIKTMNKKGWIVQGYQLKYYAPTPLIKEI